MSMVSADLLYMIHKRLCEIFVSEEYFGGKAIMFVGDLMQLRPVKGKFIFEKPRNKKYHSLHEVDSLWKTSDPIVLKTNFRQGEGSVYNEILNRARIGKLTDEDKRILEERRLNEFRDNGISSEAFHVFWTNYETETLNLKKLDEIDSPLVEIKAMIFAPKGYRPRITKHGTVDDTQFRQILKLKVGARVMLTFNICISDSLINGVLGTIVDFVRSSGTIKAVLIEFDSEEVGSLYREANKHLSSDKFPKATPIQKSSLEYATKNRRSGHAHGCKVKITQFALRLSWASTCHKIQGISMPKGQNLVAHGHKKIPAAMQYVMMSRVSNIENLFLSQNFDLEKVRPIKKALKENNRLTKIFENKQSQSYDLCFMNIRSLRKHHEDLIMDPMLQNSKLLCLAETWIYSEEEDSSWNDFLDMKKTVSSNGRGKGCAVYYQNEECFKNIKKISSKLFQIITGVYDGIQVFVLYISKEADQENIVNVMKELILPGSLFVIGDFNYESSTKNTLSKFLTSQGLTQIVKRPTHVDGGKIDHCYVMNEWKNTVNIEYIFPYFTDHVAICVKFPPNT